jgi:hypothetical protein
MNAARYLRLEEISEALRELGGEADWIDIYDYVDSVGKPPLETNAYLYTANNPVNYIDPLGLERIEAGLIYSDDGQLIGELPLEDPNPFLDPVNYVGGGLGCGLKGGFQVVYDQCLWDAAKCPECVLQRAYEVLSRLPPDRFAVALAGVAESDSQDMRPTPFAILYNPGPRAEVTEEYEPAKPPSLTKSCQIRWADNP